MNNDPRVYFAAERTLLAWLRTGIAVMGMGFLVARFGLFLRMLHPTTENLPPHPSSTLLGVSFVALGSLGIAISSVQFLRFLRSLGPSDRPPHYWIHAAAWYAIVMAVLGVTLAIYLAWGLRTA